MWAAFGRGAALGVSIALVPGPVITLIIRRSLLEGLRGGIHAVWGALAASAVHVTVAATAASLLDDRPWVLRLVWLAGGMVLLLEAASAFRRSRPAGAPAADQRPEPHSAFLSALLVNLCNPLAVVLWAAILITGAPPEGEPALVTEHWVFALGTGLGVVAWDSTVALLAAGGRQVLQARWIARLVRLSALLLLGFAAWFFYRGLTGR